MTPTQRAAMEQALEALDEVHAWAPDGSTSKQLSGEAFTRLCAALAEQPAEQEPVEMSPEFTDTARAALLWVLWHHQGGSSPVGQPIRFALGMGAHDRLTDLHVADAKRWAAQTGSTTADFHAPQPAIPPGYKLVPSRCPLCEYQYGHQIGCANNPVDIHLRSMAAPEAPQPEAKS